MKPHQIPKVLAARGIDVKAMSDEMLQLALKHPHGSELRRSYIDAALMLEPRSPGRAKGAGKPQPPDSFAFILMWHIALRTGERGAEPLARLAVATNLIHAKAAPASTAHSLAKHWRQRMTPAPGTPARWSRI